MSARSKDVLIRAAKTFIQAFLGVFLPALVIYLQGGWPQSWAAFWMWCAPVLAAALAAGISAIWNAIGLPKEATVTEDELEIVTGWNLEQRQALQEEAAALEEAVSIGRHGGEGPEAEDE